MTEDRPGRRPALPAGVQAVDTGRRFLSVHLPRFALERRLLLLARRGQPVRGEVPFALAAHGPHGPVIRATSPAAEAAGVAPGARVVDVGSLCPSLVVQDADPAQDARELEGLALWARRWCPWTAAEGLTGNGGAGVMMDITGSDRLWGGEAALMADVEGRLGVMGLSARLGLGPTQGAAWALARFAGPRAACGTHDLVAALAPLTVRALRLRPGTVQTLRRLGLKTVGDLMGVPRRSLARRFAGAELQDDPLLRLDQLVGRRPEPLAPPEAPPGFLVRRVLAEPVQDPVPHLPALCADLCAALGRAGFGARQVSLALYRTDGQVAFVEAATARATRDAAHLLRLLDGRVEGIDPGFGFDLLALAAPVAERLGARQPGLDRQAEHGDDLAHLIDRLHARFGEGALRRPVLRESHVPERREVWQAAGADPRPVGAASVPRPLRLFDPPEEAHGVIYAVPEGPPAQFTWRRVAHRVVRAAGPERIAPEWWRERPGTRLRDYYRVEDEEGRRFWIFREGLSGDRRGDAPRWFVQGAFG